MKSTALSVFLVLISLPAFSQRITPDSLLVISLRKNFEDTRAFGKHPQGWWVGFNPKSGFDLRGEVSEATLTAAVEDRRVLIMIHGMGVPFPRAVTNYKRLLDLMADAGRPSPYDLVIGLTWPAFQIKRSALHNGVIFLKANAHARKAGSMMAGMMESLVREARSVDVFTHSMGAKVAMYALEKQGERVSNLFLTAPAIGARTFGRCRRYDFIDDRVSDNVLIFYSREDPAFRLLANGKMGRRGMAGRRLPGEGKFVNVDCTPVIRSHSEYWRSPPVLERLLDYCLRN